MHQAPLPVTSSGRSPVRMAWCCWLALCFVSAGGTTGLAAQAAIDPRVAPRAAALEREGERPMAIDLLGGYLATAPDDGNAWLQLGRFYLFDARDWHLHGHRGDPDGRLYLDFAATALDQADRLLVDSALILRGITEAERALLVVEDSGWNAGRYGRQTAGTPAMPAFLLELGNNLLSSCPSGGVLLTGSELEVVSVWYGIAGDTGLDVIPLRPDLYATDSVYRQRMASALEVDPSLTVQRALAAVALRRPLCLSPATDPAAVPALAWTPFRLARVSRRAQAGGTALSITELLKATRQGGSPWIQNVRGVYDGAARHNALLCSSLLMLFGDTPPPACRP